MLFERSLIEKHLQQTGTNPTTGEPLDKSALVSVRSKASARPRPPTMTSFPSMLATFQQEWDGLMLETSRMRTELDTTRQNLSRALYQYDAACRVIVRIQRERDEARAALAAAQQGLAMVHVGAAQGGAGGEDGSGTGASSSASASASASASSSGLEGLEGEALGDELEARAAAVTAQLAAVRKGRKVPKSLATQASMAAYGERSKCSPHSSDRGDIGCLALHPDAAVQGGMVVTGAADKAVVVWDVSEGRQVARLEGLGKAACFVGAMGTCEGVFGAAGVGAGMVIGGGGGELLGWKPSGGGSMEEEGQEGQWGLALRVAPHGGTAVVAGALHPAGDVVFTAGADGQWAATELSRGRVVATASCGGEAGGSGAGSAVEAS